MSEVEIPEYPLTQEIKDITQKIKMEDRARNVLDGTDAKLTEIGWERFEENIQELIVDIEAYKDNAVEDILGHLSASIATDYYPPEELAFIEDTYEWGYNNALDKVLKTIQAKHNTLNRGEKLMAYDDFVKGIVELQRLQRKDR